MPSSISSPRPSGRYRFCAALCLLALVVGSCKPAEPQFHDVARSNYRDVLIKDVPHVKQRPDFCGEACVEMALRKLGLPLDQDTVFELSETNPEDGRGCYTAELNRALKKIGFDTGTVYKKVKAALAETALEAQWRALHQDLAIGIPSIVCMHYDSAPKTTEHFRLILGYSQQTDEVIYHEPAVEDGAYRRMKRALFLSLWPLKYSPDRWSVIRMRLRPNRLLEGAPGQRGSAARFAQHVMRLKRRLPSSDFTIVVQPPFVVIGDEEPERVRQRALTTIKWSVDKLKQDFFARDPAEIIDIWLFKDKTSYLHHAQLLFGEKPSTPYGYYSSAHQALVMNIRTGGGTLVHEIVHPFMSANFPACPPWFNEGLGSLYEQCGDRNGHIYGYTNWRLPGLQRAIKAGRVPSFKALTAMTEEAFYLKDQGTNYSQSRYLLYYLQEQGLLVKFYQEFTAHQNQDPTGYQTLQRVLKETDMAAFKKRWEVAILKLQFT